MAHEQQDIVEMADALADMCYIIAGTCVAYGIAPEGTFESPYGIYGQLDLFFHTNLDNLLQCDFVFYEIAEEKNDLDAIKESLMTMMATIFGIALHFGVPLNAVFTEVHRSNMAKLMPDGSALYRKDGKILKPDSWTPPNIRQFFVI